MFQVSGDTYQYETLSVYYTHKHFSFTKFVNSNKQPQTIKLVYAYNLLVLGLNGGRRNKYEKTFCSFTYGTLFQVSGNTYPINMFVRVLYPNGRC